MITPTDDHSAARPTAVHGVRLAVRRLCLATLALVVLVACQAVLGVLGAGPSGPVFPHAPHLDELDCSDCHEGAEEQPGAGFPATERGCMLCHKELDEGKSFDRTVAAFLVDGVPRWSNRATPYGSEVLFDHGKHFDAEVECGTCHAPQATTEDEPLEGPGLQIHGGKSRCMECHAKTERGNDCAVCHQTMRYDEPPPDHGRDWRHAHGAHSRARIAGTGETKCAQCHREASCDQCHKEEMPRGHTTFFRRRGHGLTAAMDRTTCHTCHRPDSCARCHSVSQPLSHRGSFGPPINTHCVGCHVSGRGYGCSVCHTGFPAHAPGPAPPRNAAHMAARSPIDCLSCHIALSHPNPGGDCRACHR